MEAARTSTPIAVGPRQVPSRHFLKLASDERLVGRVRTGSEQAFAVLYERHHRGILSFCRHMLGSREEAEDAVQQTFANAYRALVTSDSEINLKPWLYRIARNQCISLLRARRNESELSDEEPALAGLSDEVAQREQLRDLLRDLAALPVDQREALVLAELHDNSHVEVAAILGCEREKVKSLVFQARSSLISSREARDLPCDEIRRQLSVLSGGALRRNTIRRHLRECEGCRAFREDVKRQRQALAVVLPVIPSASLKFGAANAMAAAAAAGATSGTGVTAGGAAAGSSGPLAAVAGKLGLSAAAVKGAAATVAVTVAAGGAAVAVKEKKDTARDSRPAPIEQTSGGGGNGGNGPAGAAGALAPTAIAKGADRAEKRRERRRLQTARRKDRLHRQQSGPGKRSGGKSAGHPGGRSSVPASERARQVAERREAARQERLKRRRLEQHRRLERRQKAERLKKRRKRTATPAPAPRRIQAPAGTSPAVPPQTDAPALGGTTFP
jgi:RNA polymerase sigma factor (sigma-70 family)